MKTYANGDYISNKLHQRIGIVYIRALEPTFQGLQINLLTHLINSWAESSRQRAAIREYFNNAKRSPLAPYGFSGFARYEREMLSVNVGIGDSIAFDWTSQTVKNYNLPDAKAVFTGNKGSTKEIIALAIVPTVKVSDISHLLQQSIKKRSQFAPRALYTDTCPTMTNFGRQLSVIVLKQGLVCFI